MNLKKLFLMLTFFVLLGTTAFAQVYVSATNGDDTFGTGAQATPYRSIQKAINSAATGSTIMDAMPPLCLLSISLTWLLSL